MLICFEGPSAIGKTEMCRSLSEDYTIIPEVNQLFDRGEADSKFWYYEKQVERFQISQQSKRTSILDGDIFQPLWYNWVYGYPPESLPKQEAYDFYLRKMRERLIDFPDLYIVFHVDVEVIKERKENDPTRTRRNFAKHLKMIEAQKRYFTFLAEHTALKVEFVEYTDFAETKAAVEAKIASTLMGMRNSPSIFGKITHWLAENDAH